MPAPTSGSKGDKRVAVVLPAHGTIQYRGAEVAGTAVVGQLQKIGCKRRKALLFQHTKGLMQGGGFGIGSEQAADTGKVEEENSTRVVRRIRTNNPLERIMREIRRRTNVVGAFPDGNSALMLVAARLRHIAGTKWSQKRYLNMEALKEMHLEEQMKVI